MRSTKYDKGYQKNSRSIFPPADYVPLTPEQVRAKIGFMNRYIHLLEEYVGPDWTQKQLEKHEGLFTTCARQGVEPNWERLQSPEKKPQKLVQRARTAVSKPSPILHTIDGSLRLEPLPASQYNGWYNGKQIVTGEGSPILAACRYLNSQSITGKLKVYGPNNDFRATVDIAWGATHQVSVDGVGHTVFRATPQSLKLAA